MAETADEQTYIALITLNLPDETHTELHVTLTPPDTIVSEGVVKPLQDCTLAELQRFAENLEAEVWEVYQAITLASLDEEGIEINVSVVGQKSPEPIPLTHWQKQMVHLLPLETVAEANAEVVAEMAEEETAVTPPELAEGETVETDGDDQQVETTTAVADTTEPDDPQINLLVAASEPVHPEREVELAPHEPVIAPSQARVRIAGERLPNGHPTWMAVDVLIDESALRAAQAHALSSLDREVAGVLIGPPPEKQPDGRYVVHIIDTIIAKYTVMHGASVTYTPESWRYMNDKLIERYPDESGIIVGWYHTHPGFGIFLSGMDQFIHQNFFTQIWHVALVLDPRARTSGFFCWNRQQNNVNPIDYRWPSWAPKGW